MTKAEIEGLPPLTPYRGGGSHGLKRERASTLLFGVPRAAWAAGGPGGSAPRTPVEENEQEGLWHFRGVGGGGEFSK